MLEKHRYLMIGCLIGITIVAAFAFIGHLMQESDRNKDAYLACLNPPTGAKPAYVEFCSVFLRDWEEERRAERLRKFNEAVEAAR